MKGGPATVARAVMMSRAFPADVSCAVPKRAGLLAKLDEAGIVEPGGRFGIDDDRWGLVEDEQPGPVELDLGQRRVCHEIPLVERVRNAPRG
jgi:hypothetical protein